MEGTVSGAGMAGTVWPFEMSAMAPMTVSMGPMRESAKIGVDPATLAQNLE